MLPCLPYSIDLFPQEHYQAFAAALPHHSSLLTHLSTAQNQIGVARTALQEAKEALGTKRADLVQLWSRGQTLEEMLRILDQMYAVVWSKCILVVILALQRASQVGTGVP